MFYRRIFLKCDHNGKFIFTTLDQGWGAQRRQRAQDKSCKEQARMMDEMRICTASETYIWSQVAIGPCTATT